MSEQKQKVSQRKGIANVLPYVRDDIYKNQVIKNQYNARKDGIGEVIEAYTNIKTGNTIIIFLNPFDKEGYRLCLTKDNNINDLTFIQYVVNKKHAYKIARKLLLVNKIGGNDV